MLGYRINFTAVTKASKAVVSVAIKETITELSTVLRDKVIDSPFRIPLNNQNTKIETGIISAALMISTKNEVIGYFQNPKFMIFGFLEDPLPMR